MRVHFISIGGSVMHQLAIALHRKGYQVTGTDDEILEPARTNLAGEGLFPAHMGWHTALITSVIDAIIPGMNANNDHRDMIRDQGLGA